MVVVNFDFVMNEYDNTGHKQENSALRQYIVCVFKWSI